MSVRQRYHGSSGGSDCTLTFRYRIKAIVACRSQPIGLIHHRRPWRSFEAVEYATLEWVDWFNNCRLLEPIGNIPLAEAEDRFYAMLDEERLAA